MTASGTKAFAERYYSASLKQCARAALHSLFLPSPTILNIHSSQSSIKLDAPYVDMLAAIIRHGVRLQGKANPMNNRYFASLGRMTDTHHPAPERTAYKAPLACFADYEFRVWPSRAAMLQAVSMSERSAPEVPKWKPLVKG